MPSRPEHQSYGELMAAHRSGPAAPCELRIVREPGAVHVFGDPDCGAYGRLLVAAGSAAQEALAEFEADGHEAEVVTTPWLAPDPPYLHLCSALIRDPHDEIVTDPNPCEVR
ncbi:MAG: hypothetical protein JWO79_544 [Actinomycetia bacterium]|nr:hypothetical protein [Actinomycetes bacterium]